MRMLGLAHFRCENYSRAIAIISSLPRAKHDVELLHALGVSLVRSGRTEEAAAIFSELLRNNPDNADVQIFLAHAYAQQKQANEAISSFRKALELNPRLPGIHTAIGKLLLKNGSLSEAEKEFRDELSLYEADLEAQYLLAFTLDLEGKPEEAVSLLNKVLQRQPNHSNARYTLGKILIRKNDLAGALEHLEIAVKIDPDDSSKHFQLGEVYRKLGRREEAQRQYVTSQELKKRTSQSP
jgi:Flp pilus assembly protein TadD